MPQCTDSLGPRMVLGPDKKLGIVRDTSFQPFRPTSERFEIVLDQPAKTLAISLRLVYSLRPGDEMVIHHWRRDLDVRAVSPK